MSFCSNQLVAVGGLDVDRRNELVEEYLPLVRHVVGRLPLTLPHFMDKDDLFEIGVLGLIGAAETFDPSKGAQFKTHAYVNIRGAILDELRKHDVLPRSRRDRIREVGRWISELETELDRAPTPEEIADRSGLTIEQVESVLVHMHGAAVLSLDEAQGGGEDGGASLAESLGCMRTPSPSDDAEASELRLRLVQEIARLPEKERHMIVLYYAEGLLLKEIGEVLGVSESRVSQIHSRAIMKLNRALTKAKVAG